MDSRRVLDGDGGSTLTDIQFAANETTRVLVVCGDHLNNTVRVFSQQGDSGGVFAAPGLSIPIYSSTDSRGDVLITNIGTNTVARYSPNGSFLGTLASREMSGAHGVTVLASGSILVGNWGRGNGTSISEYSADGTFLRYFTTVGVNGPHGIVQGPDGIVYVANYANNAGRSVSRFTRDGDYLGAFESPNLLGPQGLAFDKAGNLLVTSLGLGTVQKFSPTGADLGLFASGINGAGGIAVDSDGTVYASEYWANVVRRYDPMGNRLSDLADAADGITKPIGINVIAAPSSKAQISIAENNPVGSVVSELRATSWQEGDTVSYSLASGAGDTDNDVFAVIGDELRSSVSFDFESKASYSVRLRVSNQSGATYEKSFTIDVADVIEPAVVGGDFVDLFDDTATLSRWRGLSGVPVQDFDGDYIYRGDIGSAAVLEAGSAKAAHLQSLMPAHSIRGIWRDDPVASRDLSVSARFMPRSGIDGTFSLYVVGDRGPGHYVKSGVFGGSYGRDRFAEAFAGEGLRDDPSDGDFILQDSIDDTGHVTWEWNYGSWYTLSLEVRPDATSVSIQEDGADSPSWTAVLPRGYSWLGDSLRVGICQSIYMPDPSGVYLTDALVDRVTLTTLAPVPKSLDLSTSSVPEGLATGVTVGVLSASDWFDGFSYALVAGDGSADNASFAVVGNEVRTAVSFDYEARSSYSIRLRVSNQSGDSFEKAFTIAISDVYDTPTLWRSGESLASVSGTYGAVSSAASTAIVGEWLTGDVTATAPAGFEVSSDQVTWGETTSFTAVAGMFSGTLSVRLAATANAGAHAGSVILSGGGAADLAVEIPESMVARKSLSVIGLAAADRTYDGTTTVAVIGTPSLAGTVGADTVSLAGTVGWSFPSSNAGAWPLVRTGEFSLGGDAAANYTLVQPSLSAAITPRPVSVKGVTASNRVYDAGTKVAVSTAAATLGAVTGVSASGVVAGDASGLFIDGAAASGAIPDKKIGTRTVTVTGVELAGAAAGNYVIASVNVPSVTISKAALAVDGVVAIDKPYDGTDVAKFDLTKAVLSGVFSGDVVSPAAAGTLGGVDVGGPYAVTAIVTASGADGGNYTVAAPPGLTASVVPKQLTIFGLTAASRVYDGTTDATIGGTAKYIGLASVDAIKYATPVLSGPRVGSFADKTVGTAKPVTVSGYSAPSSNYTLAPVTVSATISKRVLSVSGVVAVDKPYDGTKAAKFDLTGAVLSGVISGDVVTCAATGTLSGTNVGGPYAVTAAVSAVGADGGNYAVTAPTDLTASVVPKQLSITGLTAKSRVYDGTTNVMITGTAKYVGLASIDAAKYATPSLSGARTAAFLDKNVDDGKPVPVSGYTAPSSNYTLAPLVLSASITAKALTVLGAAATSRTYDGTSMVAVSGGSLSGVLGGDVVELVTAGAVGMTADKKAGVGRAVTVSGYSLSGVDAGNYSVTQPTGLKVTIARKVLAVTGVSARSRAYDGTIVGTASGTAVPDPVALVLGDTVTVGGLAKLTFADANVGTGKAVAASGYALSGVDAANYLVQQPAGLSADITPRALAISGLVAGSRAYDGTTNVTITGTAKYAGLAAIDATRFATPVLSGTRTAAFGDRNVGASKPVPVNGYVAPSANYTLDPLVLVASITPKMLTVTGAVASGRLYDGTTGIKVSGGSLVTNGVVAGESVTLETAAVVGTVADKRVGVGKAVTVTGYTLSGIDSANYAVSQPTTLKATITARPIAVTGLQGLDRVYDATTLALVVGEASLDAKAIVGGDDLAVATGGAKFAFTTSAVGVAKAITASGFTLSGADAGNYAIVQPAGLKATVTQATITVTGPNLVLTQDPVSGRVVIPTLTATISGLKGVDAVTGAAAFTTTATATSPKGVYAVKVGRGTLKSSANYTFAFVDGSITVQ